jgi:hypothetical protein
MGIFLLLLFSVGAWIGGCAVRVEYVCCAFCFRRGDMNELLTMTRFSEPT